MASAELRPVDCHADEMEVESDVDEVVDESGNVHDVGSTGVDGLATRMMVTVSPVDASRRDGMLALTPPVAFCLSHEGLQCWVCGLRRNPLDDAAWGRLEVMAGIHEHGDIGVHVGEGAHHAFVVYCPFMFDEQTVQPVSHVTRDRQSNPKVYATTL